MSKEIIDILKRAIREMNSEEGTPTAEYSVQEALGLLNNTGVCFHCEGERKVMSYPSYISCPTCT